MTVERKRLCIVSPLVHGGGAEYQISLLIDALLGSDRYDVYYLARHVDERVPAPGYTIVRIGDGDVVPSFGYVMDLVPLYVALHRIAPHAIYQRVACGYTGICALYACRHGVPLIWHVAHDTDVAPKTLDRGRNLLRRLLEKWSIRFGIHYADSIVVQTRHQEALLMRHYRRQATAVVANFHGEPEEVIDKTGPRTVVWIANMKRWKRPEVFVRLASALSDLEGVQFLMLGEPPTGAKNEHWRRALMQSIEAVPSLKYVGHKTQNEVNAVLASSLIFVNTSVHEGFPNTFIQAWLRHTVVVSLDVNPDGVLERERVGIQAGSEAALAQAVRMLLSSPDVRAGYVTRAARYVGAEHSLRNAAALVQLIDSRTDSGDGKRQVNA